MKYRLVILEPNKTGGSDVRVTFDSENAPFMGIQKGDLLHPGSWEIDTFAPGLSPILRVINVEHQVHKSKTDEITHTIWVYTEEVPDTSETRLS